MKVRDWLVKLLSHLMVIAVKHLETAGLENHVVMVAICDVEDDGSLGGVVMASTAKSHEVHQNLMRHVMEKTEKAEVQEGEIETEIDVQPTKGPFRPSVN